MLEKAGDITAENLLDRLPNELQGKAVACEAFHQAGPGDRITTQSLVTEQGVAVSDAKAL